MLKSGSVQRPYPSEALPGALDRSAADAEDRYVAGRLRTERHRRGLTLRELASRVSISTARLSAIEHNKQTLGVDLLLALAHALDVSLERLVPRERAAQLCIVRRLEAGSRQYQPMKLVNRVSGAATGYHNRLRPLADAFVGKRMAPLEIEIHPIPDDRLQFISHHHEEFLFVLRGEVECLLKTPDGPRREELASADCMYFWSYLPHCIRSIGREPARSLHLLFSRDEAADAELSGNEDGTIYLLDAVHKTLSDRIAAQMVALRRTRAMSIAHFANLLGTSPRRLSEIERGQKPVSVQFLLNVCHRCGKPLEDRAGGLQSSARRDGPWYLCVRQRAQQRSSTWSVPSGVSGLSFHGRSRRRFTRQSLDLAQNPFVTLRVQSRSPGVVRGSRSACV